MGKPHLTPQFNGPLTIWRQPDPGRAYSVGGDTAGGKTSDDWSVLTVVDNKTLEDVATWRGHIDPTELGILLVSLANLYGGITGQAFMVVEINNHGLATLESARLNGGWHFYCRRTWDRISKNWSEGLGFQTSMKTRPMLIARARNAFREPSIRINDPVLLEEALTFVRLDGGREDHQEGCHDDALFAWMLALEGAALAESGTTAGLTQLSEEVSDAMSETDLRKRDQSWIWGHLKKAEDSMTGPRKRMVTTGRGRRHVRVR